ncbi:MAG: inositol monophosphatase family protein [Acidimicrobiales bacterium]
MRDQGHRPHGEAGTGADIEKELRRLGPLVLESLRGFIKRHNDLKVERKSAAYDLVSDADRSIEALVWAQVHNELPGDGFLGEEHGWRSGPTGKRDWVVDPVDGTMNFVNGLPWACSAIGVLAGEEALAGLVVDPYHEDIYLSAPGQSGTELNGEPVRVMPGDDLAGKVVVLEVPSGISPEVLAPVAREVTRRGGSVRVMGSGALALACVAAGLARVVVHAGPKIWDVAAGVALVEHAGGIVVGREARYELGRPGPLVAGSAASCELLQPALAECDLGDVEPLQAWP